MVAAVSQAYEDSLVDVPNLDVNYEGLYYSTDSGATWNLATITDGSGNDVQGPADAFARRTAMRPRRWCGTRCGSFCGGGALSRLLRIARMA